MGLFGRKHEVPAEDRLPGTALVGKVEATGRRFEGDDDTRIGDIAHSVGFEPGFGSVRYRFALEVSLDDGRAPYSVEDTFKVPSRFEGDLAEGVTVPISVSRDDPRRVEIDWDAWLASGGDATYDAKQAEATREQAHATYGDANRQMMADAWVTATQGGGMSRQEFDEAIDGAVQSGMLTPAEADATRARIA